MAVMNALLNALCMGIEYHKPATGNRGIDGHQRPAMTVEEFKGWLRRFDANGDGRISRDELRQAMRSMGVRFTGRKCRRGMHHADADGDGYIDDDEIDGLIDFVRRRLRLRIIPC